MAGGCCSGSRKAVTSGAFPDNRESVPCNADSGPEGQWNIPLHPRRWGGNGRSDPFNRKGRSHSKDNRLSKEGFPSRPGVRLLLPDAPHFPTQSAWLCSRARISRPKGGWEGRTLSQRLAGRQASDRPACPADRSRSGPLPAPVCPPAPDQRLTTLHSEVRVVPLSPETPRVLQAPRVPCSLAQFLWPCFYLRVHDQPFVTHLPWA